MSAEQRAMLAARILAALIVGGALGLWLSPRSGYVAPGPCPEAGTNGVVCTAGDR